MTKKIVLAYSGGLDTTVILHWLHQQSYEVIALCLDLGQAKEDWSALRNKAMSSGAVAVEILDVKKELVNDYIWPSLMMNAQYEGIYLLGTALARPLIALKQIEVAAKHKAEYVSHGATGKGNDQARFEIGYLSLNPDIKIIAPWKIKDFYKQYPGRKELLEYANKYNLEVSASPNKPWSSDENLVHISYEAGMLEDIYQKPDEDMFMRTKSPQQSPDKTEHLDIEFDKGIPVALNGKSYPEVELYQRLNDIGSENGIGRVDLVESRFVGMKSRGVYESPAATILLHAHRQIESICLTADVIQLKDMLMPRFAALVYNGFWFSPQMDLLRSLAKQSQQSVSGQVRLELYKGNVMTTGRRSDNSLYMDQLASMEDDKGIYDPVDATGFIKLSALPFMVKRHLHNNK